MIHFEGINFYAGAFEKSEADFIAHEIHHGLSEKQLKEVYAIGKPKKTKKDVNNTEPAPEINEP